MRIIGSTVKGGRAGLKLHEVIGDHDRRGMGVARNGALGSPAACVRRISVFSSTDAAEIGSDRAEMRVSCQYRSCSVERSRRRETHFALAR